MSKQLTPVTSEPLAHRAEPLRGEVIAPAQATAPRIKVKKVGFLGAFLRPIGVALALLILGWGVLTIGTNYYRSYQRHLEYSKITHSDESYMEVLLGRAGPALSTGETKFVYKDVNGKVHRVVAATSAVDHFVNETLVALDNERDEIMKGVDRQLVQALNRSFSDRDQAIDDYADWFFEWKRSYVILKEAISSTMSRLIKTGEYESLKEAVERDVNDYFMKNYMERVLKPESRDEQISAKVELIVRTAHERFRQAVVRSDDRLQAFLAAQTRVLEELPQNEAAAKLHLDWDSRKWKAPRYSAGDMAYDGLLGVGTIAAGGTAGAVMPAVSRAIASTFAGVSRQVAASMGSRIALAEGGAVAGTALGPGVGTAIGTAAGLAVGAGVDYFMARRREKQNREDFVKANQKAIDLTIEQWRGKLRGDMDGAVKRWFDDARAGTILSRQPAKPAGKTPKRRPEGGRTNTPSS